jgi:ACS family tartrate transporter-like MFS transporter
MSIKARTERKLMMRLAAVIFLLYLLFSVDRGNIGFAGLQMMKTLGLSAEIFGLGSGLFTVAYLLFQVPNAQGLRRLGGGTAFATIACAWGVISTTTAFVPDQFWFLINRFLLGVAEAGFNAFVIYYINQMFPRRLRGFAVGLTLFAVPVSMILISPLSGLLLNLQLGGLRGWQLVFIIEGVPSILVGLLCLRIVPVSAHQMRFLSQEERAWLECELETDEHRKQNSMGSSLKESLGDPFVWALGFVLFTTVFAVNVMLIWMPQMISQLSHAGNVGVGFLNSIPWLALGIGCLLVSRLSDKVQNRITPLRPALAVAALGFILAAALQDVQPAFGFIGLVVGAFGAGAAQGVFWALTMELVSGPSSATSYAVISVLGNGSGVFAHPLIGKLHDATGSFAGVAWALALFNVAAIGTVYLIGRRVAARGARKIQNGGVAATS